LYAALAASLDERFHEGALLRTLGATRQQLRAAHLAEFALIGVLAGPARRHRHELIAYLLYSHAFDLAYRFKWPVWIVTPLAGGVLIGMADISVHGRVVQRSPLAVLRNCNAHRWRLIDLVAGS